jgi:hypothetical protein
MKKAINTELRWRVAHSGGNVNNGANAGFAALNANNTSSNRNTNIGARACSFAPVLLALALAKRTNKGHMVLVTIVNAPAK